MKAPKKDEQVIITPANGFYLCRPLKVADLIMPVKITLPEVIEKIKALSMSLILAIWKPADPNKNIVGQIEIPAYTVGDVITHREQGQNTFALHASAKPFVFVHHTMILGQIQGVDLKKDWTAEKPRLVR